MPVEDLFKPFQTIANLLTDNDQYKIVPFRQWDVRTLLDMKNPPKNPGLKLTAVPGIFQVIEILPGAGNVITDLGELINDLAKGHLDRIFADLTNLIPDTLGFVRHQLGLGLSVGALIRVVTRPEETARTVVEAYESYFFEEGGFTTVEGGKIVPPSFDIGADASNPTLAQIASQVRKFASHKTADQYIRDLVRITVEAGGDKLFNLGQRYNRLMPRTDDLGKKEQSWLRGFASFAESAVTSAVEEAAQGISTFSTNPLIAASLATFTGTAARKATQNAFFLELGL